MAIDVEKLARDYLASQFPDNRFCTELPVDYKDHLPIVQVTRAPGAVAQVIDRANITADVYGSDRLAAREYAHQVWDSLRCTLPGSTVSGTVVPAVATNTAPYQIPHPDENVRLFRVSVQLIIKQPLAS